MKGVSDHHLLISLFLKIYFTKTSSRCNQNANIKVINSA